MSTSPDMAAPKAATDAAAGTQAPSPATKKRTSARAAAKQKRRLLDRQHTKKKDALIFGVTVVLMTVYLLWRLFCTLPLDQGVPQMVFAVMLLIAEGVTTMTTFELYWRKLRADTGTLQMPVIPPTAYPDVDVLIATHNEPVDVLYKTACACTFMDYPDKSRVHIYFSDDGCRPEVKALARRLGIGYIKCENNEHAKSGNLNNALAHTTSPLIATFDADMIPRRTFLMDTVPYFALPDYIRDDQTQAWRPRTEDERDPKLKVGLIQTPQSFYNLDLFQFNLYAEDKIPNEQDFFSREVNQMRNSSNACAYTGSNALISRAGMEEIGGFPYHTITEDFETSVRLQMAGYITYATDKVEAHGLSTTDVRSMMRQRIRWARGVIQSTQNTHVIFSRKLPLSARITYLNGFLYWWSFFNRIIFILAPIMFALFDFQVVNCDLWQLLIFWLPSYFFYSKSMKLLSSNVRSQKWSQIIDTTLAPSLIIPVAMETLHIREKKFKVTSKKKETSNSRSLWNVLPLVLLAVLSIAAIVRFVWGKYGMALVYSSVIIYWLCYNLIAILYAIAFMLGRDMPRRSTRIEVDEAAEVSWEGGRLAGRTRNMSDEGVLVHLEGTLPEDVHTCELVVTSKLYETRLHARIVRTWNDEDAPSDAPATFCAMEVEPVDEEARRQYVQIMYDRDPGIIEEMDSWNTTYDDFVRIVRLRLKGLIAQVKVWWARRKAEGAQDGDQVAGCVTPATGASQRSGAADVTNVTGASQDAGLSAPEAPASAASQKGGEL